MFPIWWQSYPMGGKVALVYGTNNVVCMHSRNKMTVSFVTWFLLLLDSGSHPQVGSGYHN